MSWFLFHKYISDILRKPIMNETDANNKQLVSIISKVASELYSQLDCKLNYKKQFPKKKIYRTAEIIIHENYPYLLDSEENFDIVSIAEK
jgi:hypothetical protein